jgi:hypothetical protein
MAQGLDGVLGGGRRKEGDLTEGNAEEGSH